MWRKLFESREKAHRDSIEIQNLQTSYGSAFRDELRMRAQDEQLDLRDRKHWKRLLSKANKL